TGTMRRCRPERCDVQAHRHRPPRFRSRHERGPLLPAILAMARRRVTVVISIHLKVDEAQRACDSFRLMPDLLPLDGLRVLGLGYDVLAKTNPGIIYLALKGFLPGPYEARPFLDELAQMSAGLAYMTGPKGQPMRAGASIVDVGAAAYGVIAVLAALQQRARTGCGQKITSGLFETTVFWVGQWLARFAATGEPSVPMPEIRQGTRMGWGVYQLFTAADDEQEYICIASIGLLARFCV